VAAHTIIQEDEQAMTAARKHWKTSKIDVRFNHWEVEPIIERIPMKLVDTCGIAAFNGPNHSQYKHLGGTLSLSTTPSLNTGDQARHKDDSSNMRTATVRDYDLKISPPNGSPASGQFAEYDQVDEMGTVPQNVVPLPHGCIKSTVSFDLHQSIATSMSFQLPESTDEVASIFETATEVRLTPPLTPLAADRFKNDFNDILTEPERPVSAGQSITPAADDFLLQHDFNAPRAVDDKFGRKTKSHNTKLGQIRSEDILLIQWTDAARDWSWILQERQKLGSAVRARGTLRRRRKLVAAALHHAGLLANSQLLTKVALGDPEACQILNAHCPASYRLEDFTIDMNLLRIRPSRSGNGPAMRPVAIQASFTPVTDIVLPSVVATKAHMPEADEHNPETRVTTGGKTILPGINGIEPTNTGAEDLPSIRATTGGKTILPGIDTIEEEETDYENLSTISDRRYGTPDVSEISPEDYCHFAYQVLRQEFYCADANDVHEAMQAADSAPMLCGIYDDIQKCNKAVMAELFKQYPGTPLLATGATQEEWSLKHATSEHGEVICTLFKKGVGALCVRTQRLLRTFYEGTSPNSRAGHLSRSVFTVHEQTTRAFTDDLFGEDAHQCCDDEIVRANVFTSLRHANEIAIDVFAKTTTQHSSGRLDDIFATIQRTKRQYADEIDIDAELFDRNNGYKRVCVRKLKLCGPTNL
jgi:hypothetical protein